MTHALKTKLQPLPVGSSIKDSLFRDHHSNVFAGSTPQTQCTKGIERLVEATSDMPESTEMLEDLVKNNAIELRDRIAELLTIVEDGHFGTARELANATYMSLQAYRNACSVGSDIYAQLASDQSKSED